MTTYVSDILETLLDAGSTRAAVRRVVMERLEAVPAHQRSILARPLHYYGGKCMGYPAVWAVSEAFQLDRAAEDRLVQAIRGTLFANITTSVVDDLYDRDEPSDPRQLGVLYLLIYEALASSEWSEAYHAPAMRAFADALDSAVLDVWPGGGSNDVIRSRGQRIGAFFGLTGFAAAKALGLGSAHENAIVALLTDFGIVCGHLDDAIDVADDLAKGDTTNAVLLALGQRKLAEFDNWLAIVKSARGHAVITQFLRDKFDKLADSAIQHGWDQLARRFTAAGDRIADHVPYSGPRSNSQSKSFSWNNDG